MLNVVVHIEGTGIYRVSFMNLGILLPFGSL